MKKRFLNILQSLIGAFEHHLFLFERMFDRLNLQKFNSLGREFLNFELIGPLQFAATTVLWRLVIKSLKYSLSLKEGW